MTDGSAKVSEFGMAAHTFLWMSYMDIKAWPIFGFVQIFPTWKYFSHFSITEITEPSDSEML